MNKNIENLEKNDILYLIECYNNYIMEFDYENSGEPVSIYEFMDYEFQEILNEKK